MAKQIIAFDIGGTNTRCALIEKNKIIKFDSVPTPKTKKEFLNNISRMIDIFNSRRVKGIGIAFPSTIENGVVKNPVNVPLHNFDLKSHLKNKHKKRIEILNDATCVALAEQKLSCKKKNFVVLTLGTGIGGGIIANGEIYQGLGQGSEFGHMYVRGKDFESLWKKTKRQMQTTYGKNTLICDLVKIKEKRANQIMKKSADYLGEGIASIIAVLDPEEVIIAGGLKTSGPKFIKLINDAVKKYSFIKRNTKVSWSKIPEPGIMGASLLID